MKDKYLVHEFRTVENIRAFVEDIGDRYRGRNAYSFRTNPRDKEATRVKYEQLRDDVRALATAFVMRGMAGKHIVLVGKLTYQWVLTYYATLATGSVLIPLDAEWHAPDLADTATRADVDFVLCEGKLAEKCQAISDMAGVPSPILLDGEGENTLSGLMAEGKEQFDRDPSPYYDAPIDRDALALMVFTSGTTGKGKGVKLTQRNFMSCLECVIPYIDFADKTMGLLPPHHTYGSSVSIFGHNFIGIEVYLSGGLKYIMNELKAEKPGHLVLVPLYLETFYRRITQNIKDQGMEGKVKLVMNITKIFGKKLGTKLRRKLLGKILAAFGGELRMVISGGAPINNDIIKFFESLGISVLNGYGITECAPIIAVNYSRNVKHGSVGNILPCNTVKIDSPNENGEGEICVKGTNVMLGYYKDEENTREAFDEDGYFRTGDYGKIDKDGMLYITGRKKNLIILSNGKNVYPEEIESEFVAIPGLLDIIIYEGQSRRGIEENKIVAEIFPDYELLKKNGIEDPQAYFQKYINDYNRTAISYKKIGMLKVRTEDFPKNTLRKIMRFKLDMTID